MYTPSVTPGTALSNDGDRIYYDYSPTLPLEDGEYSRLVNSLTEEPSNDMAMTSKRVEELTSNFLYKKPGLDSPSRMIRLIQGLSISPERYQAILSIEVCVLGILHALKLDKEYQVHHYSALLFEQSPANQFEDMDPETAYLLADALIKARHHSTAFQVIERALEPEGLSNNNQARLVLLKINHFPPSTKEGLNALFDQVEVILDSEDPLEERFKELLLDAKERIQEKISDEALESQVESSESPPDGFFSHSSEFSQGSNKEGSLSAMLLKCFEGDPISNAAPTPTLPPLEDALNTLAIPPTRIVRKERAYQHRAPLAPRNSKKRSSSGRKEVSSEEADQTRASIAPSPKRAKHSIHQSPLQAVLQTNPANTLPPSPVKAVR